MKRKSKDTEHFQIVDGTIVMEEKDIPNLTESENIKISFYVKTLGYDIVFIEPEPKKKYYFTVEKAEKYLKKKDKAGLATFNELRKDADIVTAEYKALKKAEKEGGKNKPNSDEIKMAQKAMISAQRDAYIAQKKWFKETYGIEEYDIVRKEY